jgi:hypothetical protein
MSSFPAFSTPSAAAEFTVSPKLRAAFQWWQDCWFRDAAHQEETIRDGALQEIFSLRRGLELSSLTGLPPPSSEISVWIDQLELLYRTFDRLGDRLHPPYLEDSLDLALQHMMGPWIDKYPGITLSVQHPRCLDSSMAGFNRILLFAVEQLLLLFHQVQDMMTVRVLLTEKDTLPILRLSLELTQQNLDDLDAVAQEIEYLQLVFSVLVDGHLIHSASPTLLSCEFSWNSVSA